MESSSNISRHANDRDSSGGGNKKRRNEEGDLCHLWAHGECHFGDRCNNEHPDQLNPVISKKMAYSFPNEQEEKGKVCQSCVQARRLNCDREEAGGLCSICRWYGGDKGKCLPASHTYNDSVWQQMMSRRTYDILPPKPLLEAAKMPDKNVPADWAGKSLADIGQPPSIPDLVLKRPRAYLLPPNKTQTRKTAPLKQRRGPVDTGGASTTGAYNQQQQQQQYNQQHGWQPYAGPTPQSRPENVLPYPPETNRYYGPPVKFEWLYPDGTKVQIPVNSASRWAQNVVPPMVRGVRPTEYAWGFPCGTRIVSPIVDATLSAPPQHAAIPGHGLPPRPQTFDQNGPTEPLQKRVRASNAQASIAVEGLKQPDKAETSKPPNADAEVAAATAGEDEDMIADSGDEELPEVTDDMMSGFEAPPLITPGDDSESD